MANILFRLRTYSGTKPQRIYLIYRFGRNDKLAFPVGLSVAPQHWNKRTARARDIVECVTKDIINNRLNELETLTTRYIAGEIAAGRTVTKTGLRGFLLSLSEKPTPGKTDFLAFIDSFVSNVETRTNPATGLPVSLRTKQEYRKFSEYIYKFAQKKRKQYAFADIDLDFYEDFTEFLRNDCKLSINTIGKIIKDLKAVLNEATTKGANIKIAYKSTRFKVVSEETNNIYLTEKELQQIADLDLSGCLRLDRVRDLFLVGAWTGLRFSDFTRITPGNVHNGLISIEQHKTGKRVAIPLHKTVSDIWAKYNGRLPQNISNQKMNEYIKEVAQMAGIDTPETQYLTKGGIKATKTVPKWQLVSTHTARRSFATNLYLSGFPALSIMQITGHKTEKAFLRYIKVTGEQHANLLRLHWIKNGQFIKVAK